MEVVIEKEEVVNRLKHNVDLIEMKVEILNSTHEIVEINGKLCWKEENSYRDEIGNLCDVLDVLYEKGLGRNDEEFRDIYRRIGSSLYTYWEVFYWIGNNHEVEDYDFFKSFENRLQ